MLFEFFSIMTVKLPFVNFIGAIVFSVFGYFYVVNRGKGNFVSRFIPRLKDREHH